MQLATHPLVTNTWTCGECETPGLKSGYVCETCHGVFCQTCADLEAHHEPTTGLICGERNIVDLLADDAT